MDDVYGLRHVSCSVHDQLEKLWDPVTLIEVKCLLFRLRIYPIHEVFQWSFFASVLHLGTGDSRVRDPSRVDGIHGGHVVYFTTNGS